MTRPQGVLAACLALGVSVALYTYRLGDAPAYLNLDEAHFGNHAYSIATTGRDLNGNVLPLFVSLEDPLGDRPVLAWGTTWYHPVGFYSMAAALTLVPLSEWAIRLPIALIGVLNGVLGYLVALRWFGDRRVASVAAALLLLAPAHFILSRMAVDYLLPVTFMLGWLLALHRLTSAGDRRSAVIAGVVLGAGCYSYVSSWLLMPAYLGITAVVVWKECRRPELLWPLVLGFAAPLMLLLPWLAMHPEMPGNIVSQYQAGESQRSLLSAVVSGEGVSSALRKTLSAYWSYFNPSFLFVSGGSSRLVSTGGIGVWPAGMLVLLLFAVMRMLRAGMGVRDRIIMCGLLLAPVPAALKGEPFAIQRAVSLLPFGALLAASAFVSPGSRPLASRAILALALLTVPIQFGGFTTDYFDAHRTRGARAVDSTAFKETADAVRDLKASTEPPAFAVMAPLYDISAKWRFYATAYGQPQWLTRTRYFSGDFAELSDLAPGAIAIVDTATLSAHDGWDILAAPRAVFGEAPLTILKRQ